jgi:hypothetical protein
MTARRVSGFGQWRTSAQRFPRLSCIHFGQWLPREVHPRTEHRPNGSIQNVNTISARRRNTVFVSTGLAVAAVMGCVSLATGSRAADPNTHVQAACTFGPYYVIGVEGWEPYIHDTHVVTPQVVIPC